MFKIFKSVDEKFKDIGFKKVADSEYCVAYERKDKKYHFTQMLTILHKKSGRHIVQSYDLNLFDIKNIGNTCVGLTYYEMKLVSKKMRQKKWHKKWKGE